MFRLFVQVVKRELIKFDNESGRNFSKNYLLIGFWLYRDFLNQVINDDVIKFQIDTVGGIPEDILSQYIIANESIQSIFDTRPPDVLRNNIRNLERLLTFIDNEIEITSQHSLIFDNKTTKRIYLTAVLLQIVYPEKYPKDKYNNKKAIKEAVKILELNEDEFGEETKTFQSISNSYRQFKKAFNNKYKFRN